MAYIDREAFAEKIKKCSAFKKIPFEGGILQNVVLDLLGNHPTADVVEVKHGEWKQDFDEKYYCSRCGRYPKQDVRDYCPYCGAKMDGGRTE